GLRFKVFGFRVTSLRFKIRVRGSSVRGYSFEFRKKLIVKKFLIILDDLWNQWGDEDLNNIGIPLVESDKGSKVILTTREQKVCKYIRCEHMVQLNVMDDDEA
ncbi:hypothetical protein Gohar_024663, partial [Gossypium harknessii]|nr:hypothetical protein [Gossypium harknessii]